MIHLKDSLLCSYLLLLLLRPGSSSARPPRSEIRQQIAAREERAMQERRDFLEEGNVVRARIKEANELFIFENEYFGNFWKLCARFGTISANSDMTLFLHFLRSVSSVAKFHQSLA